MSLRQDMLYELERADARSHLAAIKQQLSLGSLPRSRTSPPPAHDAELVQQQRARALRGVVVSPDTFLDSRDRVSEE